MSVSRKNKTTGQPVSRLVSIHEKAGLPMIGFFALQMILGFEWFWSGPAKLMMPGGFPKALPDALGEMAQNSPVWYANFLNGFVLSHAMTFGYVIEISEFLIGVAFLFGPLIWFFAWDRIPVSVRAALFFLTAAAAIGGFFMAVNFHIAMGNSQPWILPTFGLDESVDLDSMVAAMQIVIATIHIALLAYLRQERREKVPVRSQIKPTPIGHPNY